MNNKYKPIIEITKKNKIKITMKKDNELNTN